MKYKSILDPKFKYRDSRSTDVRKTFERVRREMRLAQQQQAPSSEPENRGKVVATIGQGIRRSAA
jgi:hypothetical protein